MRWSRGATGPAILAALALAAAPLGAQQDDAALTTRAERTDYVETSRLEAVQRFLDALAARSDLVRVGTFGTSEQGRPDRKSTSLNSSHVKISYAVLCMKKKKN